MEIVTRRAGFDSWRRCCRRWLATLTVVSSTGCATVLNSGPKPVGFNSDPDGADVVVNGEVKGTTPVTLDLHPERDYTVVISKRAYDDYPVALGTHTQPGWVILDVFAFGLLAITVDAITGEWKAFDFSEYHAQLIPASTPQVTQPPRADSVLEEHEPTSKSTGGMCFRGRPPPDCNSFWITEVGYSALLTSDDNRQLGSHYVSGELGLMFNSGGHMAYGFTAFVGGLGGTGSIGPATRGGVRARVRRWLSAGTAIDLSAGPMYTGTGKIGLSSQVGLSFSDKFLLVAQLEHVSKVRYRDYYRQVQSTASPTDVYLGIRFGSKPAAIALLAAGVFLGLGAAATAGF